MTSNEPTAPTDAPKTKPPMSKPLVVFAVVAYVAFLIYSCTRALYAECPSGETVSKGWQLSDALVACGVGGILAAVARGALNSSDLPEDVKTKIDTMITSIEELRQTEETTLAEIRERRASLWVPEQTAAPAGSYKFPTPAAQEPAAPADEDGALTTREVVLSSGHHAKVRVRRDA